MLSFPQSTFIKLDVPIPPAGRPSRMEERRVSDLIQRMKLDEDRIRARREDLWNDRYLCFTALRGIYPDCPIELTYENIYSKESRSLNALAHLLSDFGRSAEFRGYVTVRREFWAAHPSLRKKPCGMVFTPIRQHSYVVHDSPAYLSKAYLTFSVFDAVNPLAHKNVYLQSWPSFLEVLKKTWKPTYFQELNLQCGPNMTADPVATLTSQMKFRNLLQRDLAQAIQVTEPFVSNCFRGRKQWPPDTLKAALEWVNRQPVRQPQRRS